MRRQGMSVGLAVLLFLTASAGLVEGQAKAVPVGVLFDFGDGQVRWGHAVLAENRTALNATEIAAASLGLSVEVIWFDFGAFVADIGSRDPIFPEFFQLLLWNKSIPGWEPTVVGASALLLEQGDIMGWFLTLFDSETSPMATPLHPFPTIGFRNDLANTGSTGSPVPESPGLRWRFDTGGGEIGASPVGAGGTLYQVTLFNGTYAVDLQTGKRLWSAGVSGLSTPTLYREAGFVMGPGMGNPSRPADLLVGSKDGALYRLDGRDGTVMWRTPLLEEAGFTGIASSPKISGGRVLVGLFNESGGSGGLASVEVQNGSIHWRIASSSVHMSSPAIQKGAIYVGLMGLFNATSLSWAPPYGLLSVHEANGTERWTFPTSGPVASSPAVVDGVVYFTSRDGYLYAVSTEGDLIFQRQIGAGTSSPAVREGLVVAGSGVLGATGQVAAFSTDGQPVWEFAPNGPVQSSITLAGDLVLFATNTAQGSVHALWAENGSVAWSYVPEPAQYILPTPVVVDGHVLVASDNGFLYALVSEVATRPVVAITSPASGTNLTDAAVTVMGTASDDVAVSKVEVSRDGPPWMLASGTTSWQVTLVLPDGTHTLTARVTDNAGNANETSVVVTVQLPREEVPPIVYVPLVVSVITALVLVAAVYLWTVRRRRSP